MTQDTRHKTQDTTHRVEDTGCRRFFLVPGVMCLVSFCFLFTAPGLAGDAVCFNDHCFSVEIADTPEAQIRGLQFRHSLPKDAGMLFVFERPLRYSFWMKDTLIPLDMIWLDQDFNVVHIEHNVSPCTADQCESYSPPAPAFYVLELNAGTAASIDLKPGDYLERK